MKASGKQYLNESSMYMYKQTQQCEIYKNDETINGTMYLHNLGTNNDDILYSELHIRLYLSLFFLKRSSTSKGQS